MKKLLIALLLITGVARGQVGAIYRSTKVDQTNNTTGAFVTQTSDGNFETATGLFLHLDYEVGVTGSGPVDGDFDFINSKLINQTFLVFKNGVKLDSGANYSFNNSTGVISYFDAMADDDLFCIRGYPKIYAYWPAFEGAAPAWHYLTYPTTAGAFSESPAHTFNGGGASTGYAAQGLSATTLTGDGGYKMQYHSSSDNGTLFGWKATNSIGDFTTYTWGIYFAASGEIYKIVAGTTSDTGVALSDMEWARLHRIGSTIKLQKSADGLTGWTDVHTFSTTSSATLYFLLNPYESHISYNAQYILE